VNHVLRDRLRGFVLISRLSPSVVVMHDSSRFSQCISASGLQHVLVSTHAHNT